MDRFGWDRFLRHQAGRLGADHLLLHGAEESARDCAEGERLAYVAATRARDVLIVPAIGDEVYEGGLLDPLMKAVYPSMADRRKPSAAAGCPAFRTTDTVMWRPDNDPARTTTVAPGEFTFAGSPDSGFDGPPFDSPPARSGRGDYRVVWWDPHALALDAGASFGLRPRRLDCQGRRRCWFGAAARRRSRLGIGAGRGHRGRPCAVDSVRAPSRKWPPSANCRCSISPTSRFTWSTCRASLDGRSGRASARSCTPRWPRCRSTPTSPSSGGWRRRRAGCSLAREREWTRRSTRSRRR